jgi:hypothetical protein
MTTLKSSKHPMSPSTSSICIHGYYQGVSVYTDGGLRSQENMLWTLRCHHCLHVFYVQ